MSKYAIIDYRAGNETIGNISNYFSKVVLTKPVNVHSSISGHPDIQICKLSNSEITVCPSQLDYLKSELDDIKIHIGASEPSITYPEDVYYNVACFSDVAIHKFACTDKITLAVIKQKFSKHINVEQGYSKCSVCFINDGAVITDDEGIYETLVKNCFDVLKISKGDILLKEMNYGFFGGATGYYDGKLFLNGELKYHTDSKQINDFLNKHNTKLIELKKGAIEDIGSIICLSSKIYT